MIKLENELRTALNKAYDSPFPYAYVYQQGAGDNADTLEMISKILNSIFNAIIGIVMFLCFFALSSNMSANLLD